MPVIHMVGEQFRESFKDPKKHDRIMALLENDGKHVYLVQKIHYESEEPKGIYTNLFNAIDSYMQRQSGTITYMTKVKWKPILIDHSCWLEEVMNPQQDFENFPHQGNFADELVDMSTKGFNCIYLENQYTSSKDYDAVVINRWELNKNG